MKKIFTLFLCSGLFGLLTFSQDTSDYKKEGINFGVLPAVGYDADLGLQLGAVGNIFHYGDGSNYPRYDHSLFLMVTAFTRGSIDFILFFDSFTLVPGKRFTLRSSYNQNRAMPFYGFNGYQTVYNTDWENSNHPDYFSRMFYNYDRELLNINIDLQDTIGSSNFNWFLGWDFGAYKTGPVDIQNLNSKKNNEDL